MPSNRGLPLLAPRKPFGGRRCVWTVIIVLLTFAQWTHAVAADRPPSALHAATTAVLPQWPFYQPQLSVLRRSQRKVFAHYFTQFPISIDNADPARDYYAVEYLTPSGEHGKHLAYGGYLRERPLPRPVRPEPNWKDLDMETEVRRAAAIGLDGFTVDILSDHGYHWDAVNRLMQAAERVDPGFKIIPMLDMTAEIEDKTGKPAEGRAADVVRALSRYSSAYRLPDGRLVVSAFRAEIESPDWWRRWLAGLKAEGIDIAFVPLFLDWKKYAPSFAPISFGLSDWGWRSVKPQAAWRTSAAEAHKYCPVWMMPVAPQDMRPYGCTYWDAHNSEQFRVMWDNAIRGQADWVQIITWNDYSENTEIAPSSGTQNGFYDLAAYYIAWFKTGRPPKITHDTLYYFCRNQSASASPDPNKQPTPFAPAAGTDPPSNDIELIAFLTRPGTLEIAIGRDVRRLNAPAGLTSFRVPLVSGRPVFRLVRGTSQVLRLDCDFDIDDHIIYQDLLYRSGSTLAHIPY